jgi:tight adherence protein B
MAGIVALLLFAFFALVGYAVSGWAEEREEAKEVLGRRLTSMTGAAVGAASAAVLKDRRLSRIGFLNTILQRLGITKNLVRVVRQAGLQRRVGEVLLYMLLLAAAAFLLVTLLVGRTPFAVIAAVIGGLLPLMIVLRMRRRRLALFGEQLPDALDLVRAALQAGHGLMAAMTVVAEEFPDPVAQEFRDVSEEVRLGRPLREALDNLAERTANPDVALLQVGILTAQDIGGNLAEVIDKISHTIRERFKLQRDTQVLTAQGRMSGGVITALPLVVGVATAIFNPGFLNLLFETTAGHYMLAYAATSLLLGHFVIRRLVRIEV